MADIEEKEVTQEAVKAEDVTQENAENNAESGNTDNGNPDNGKMSSKSSDISIEEIGPEEVSVEKEENAEVLVPEPEEKMEEIEPQREALNLTSQKESVSDDEDEDDEDDIEDETLLERIVGLGEMFPEGLTNLITTSSSNLVAGAKWAYGKSRSLSWIVCSSATIMFLPVMIEVERLGLEEAQKAQQRQILMGPGAAMSGGKAQANAPLPSI